MKRNRSLEVARSFLYHVVPELEGAAKFLGKGRRRLLKFRIEMAKRAVDDVYKELKELTK